MNPIKNKRILLGVTGSIAAYKAADLASKLAQSGADVEVILTESAARFVSALTYQSVTGRAAHTDADLWDAKAHVLHVSLSRPADLFLIAPATANTIAKLAHGLADNLLTITALAAACPLVLTPAMDGGMFASAATQENLAILERRGVLFIGPEEGHLASGLISKGRMSEPGEIVECVRYLLSRGGPLAERKIVVTAGGTQEPLDPVRVLTNRSSGKQGYAIAQAALDAGADVTLISAPATLAAPIGATIRNVHTAAEMQAAVMQSCADADALIMAAAVADFRPVMPSSRKLKKESGIPTVQLERTEDILAQVVKARKQNGQLKVIVGFAAETENLEANARAKLLSKELDLIIANDVSRSDSGFGMDTNRVTILESNGTAQELPTLTKQEVAETIIDRVREILETRKE